MPLSILFALWLRPPLGFAACYQRDARIPFNFVDFGFPLRAADRWLSHARHTESVALAFAFLLRTSAIDASIMALGLSSVRLLSLNRKVVGIAQIYMMFRKFSLPYVQNRE